MMDREKIISYVLQLVEESTPDRTAWNIEKIRAGKSADWNYIDGCMLTALLEIARITGDSRYSDFAEKVVDHFVREDGSILSFQPEKYNLDDISEGRVLFELYERSGREKYRKAADFLRRQLDRQPRTKEGNFWHKAIYPNQVWLDGIYMAQPFYAMYETHFGTGDCSDTVKQIRTVYEKMRDPRTGLYYHGYDSEKTVFWADRETGLSKNFWLRAIGWFSAAAADLIGILGDPDQKKEITEIFCRLMNDIRVFADPDTGMYWQVVDQCGREGNYLETSGSCMIAYAMLKAARLGVLDPSFRELGKKTIEGVSEKYLSFTENTLNLGGICLVAGLGPENNPRRDGTYGYYISEPVVENDAKGVAPFIMAFTEIMRL